MTLAGMRKPSVVFFNRVYPPGRGATGRVLRDLARAFVRDGWDVTVITSGPKAGLDHDGSIRLVRVRAKIKSRTLISYGWVLFKMYLKGMRMKRPDLIITMTDPPLLVVIGGMLAKSKNCKHMHWCQDLYPDLLPTLGFMMPGGLMRYLKKISRQAMKKCDKVVVIGRCMAKALTHTGLDPRRIAVIPNWPDRELGLHERRRKRLQNAAAKSPSLAARARKQLKPFEALFQETDPKFRILYSGNIGRAHPVKTVLDAAELLAPAHPEIEFVFVGDGPNFDRLAHERTRRGLHNIKFLPWQPANRLRALMESGDVHLVTMHEDANGLLVPSKLYSALAVGRPCILVGPEKSETARVIRDFKAGEVVPQGDAKRLAQTIRTYRLSSEAWFAAHQGAAKAGKIFLPEESIKAWIERARDVTNLTIRVQRRRAA